jgi:vacuolar-type H+-ATPase subunit I/STV1
MYPLRIFLFVFAPVIVSLVVATLKKPESFGQMVKWLSSVGFFHGAVLALALVVSEWREEHGMADVLLAVLSCIQAGIVLALAYGALGWIQFRIVFGAKHNGGDPTSTRRGNCGHE